MKKLTWIKQPHAIWGENGYEQGASKICRPGTFPLVQWRAKHFSIIPPCGITFNLYELYDDSSGEIWRFDDFEKATAFAEKLRKLYLFHIVRRYVKTCIYMLKVALRKTYYFLRKFLWMKVK